jgi:ketosteroid isomerase-like protein
MRLRKTCLLLLLLVASFGCAIAQNSAASSSRSKTTSTALQPSKSSAVLPDSVPEQIVAANRQMVETFKRGDLLGVARFYADDATIFSYRGQKIQGREAIDRYWTGSKGAKDWKLEVIELGGDKETVYQIGKSSLTTNSGGAEKTYVCDFVVIWKRQQDGTYKIYVDIYN